MGEDGDNDCTTRTAAAATATAAAALSFDGSLALSPNVCNVVDSVERPPANIRCASVRVARVLKSTESKSRSAEAACESPSSASVERLGGGGRVRSIAAEAAGGGRGVDTAAVTTAGLLVDVAVGDTR